MPTLVPVAVQTVVTASLHDRDFYGWVEQQCAALRAHDSSRLDWDGLKEELEALGRQEYRELVSRLGVLLEQNPSLQPRLEGALEDGFQSGVDLVLRETELGLRALPAGALTQHPFTRGAQGQALLQSTSGATPSDGLPDALLDGLRPWASRCSKSARSRIGASAV